ncbi:unnamed protein product [Polarella glacialis]|uniref:Uncharacterized protein n=1 Tax=Polarella glacialis TaxID=89957 RepID=A0A813G798_POLGL|nr:unnamed protein product [Polarella glacialis]
MGRASRGPIAVPPLSDDAEKCGTALAALQRPAKRPASWGCELAEDPILSSQASSPSLAAQRAPSCASAKEAELRSFADLVRLPPDCTLRARGSKRSAEARGLEPRAGLPRRKLGRRLYVESAGGVPGATCQASSSSSSFPAGKSGSGLRSSASSWEKRPLEPLLRRCPEPLLPTPQRRASREAQAACHPGSLGTASGSACEVSKSSTTGAAGLEAPSPTKPPSRSASAEPPGSSSRGQATLRTSRSSGARAEAKPAPRYNILAALGVTSGRERPDGEPSVEVLPQLQLAAVKASGADSKVSSPHASVEGIVEQRFDEEEGSFRVRLRESAAATQLDVVFSGPAARAFRGSLGLRQGGRVRLKGFEVSPPRGEGILQELRFDEVRPGVRVAVIAARGRSCGRRIRTNLIDLDLGDRNSEGLVDVEATVISAGDLESQELALQPGEFVVARTLSLGQDAITCRWRLWGALAERHGAQLVGRRILVRGAGVHEFNGEFKELTGCAEGVEILDAEPPADTPRDRIPAKQSF